MITNNVIHDWIMANNTRRWICFIPVSFLLSIVVGLILGMTALRDNDSIINLIINSLVSGFVLLFIAGYISPKKSGSIFLLSFWLILLALTAFFMPSFERIMMNIGLAIGAIIGYATINQGSE